MKKIKVLHVVYSFGIGGLEKGIAMLINHASPEFDHQILCLTESGDSRQLIQADIPIHEMHKPPGNSIGFVWRLAKKIRQIAPDVVHTRNWSGVDGIIAARLAGCKAVVHGEHGWGMDDPQGTNRKRLLVRRWLSLGVKELTAVSQQMKGWLEQDVRVFRPVRQIYNGVDFDQQERSALRSEVRQQLGLPQTAFVIGTVSRLDPIKDHAGLIAAFAELRQQRPDCQLLIVGDGPEQSNLQQIKSEGVHLLGMRTDVRAILQELDLFVLPSLNEGISNTILEAMAAGLPVVATNVGGTPELIHQQENGLLVEARDYPALTAAMLRYRDEPELRAAHGAQGRQFIADQFSISAMVNAYQDVWRRVAGQ